MQVSVAEKLQSLYERLHGYEPPSLQFFDDLQKRSQERNSRVAKKKTEFIKVETRVILLSSMRLCVQNYISHAYFQHYDEVQILYAYNSLMLSILSNWVPQHALKVN